MLYTENTNAKRGMEGDTVNAMLKPIIILWAVVAILLTGCGSATPLAPAPAPTEIVAAATPTTAPTAIPPTVPPTETPVPQPLGPTLTYKEDSWDVMSIEACGTIHTSTFDQPNTVFSSTEGALIRLTLKCTTQRPLFGVLQEIGGSPFQAIKLVDASQDEHPAISIGGGGLDTCETNYIIFAAVREDQLKLSVKFAGETLELPEAHLRADCPYR